MSTAMANGEAYLAPINTVLLQQALAATTPYVARYRVTMSLGKSLRLMDAEPLAAGRTTPPTALMTLVFGWLSPFVMARLCVVGSQNFRGQNTWPVL